MSSQIYSGGASDSSKIQFEERKKYLDFINQQDVSFLDTLYDKKLYGFINSEYQVVTPVENSVIFGDYAGQQKGLNFTVRMFNDFRNFFFDLVRNTDIQPPELLSDLVPSRSFVSFDNSYRSHIRTVALEISGRLRNTGYEQELPFSQFVQIINNLLFTEELFSTRVSKSGFALSELCTVYHTGLYVDLGRNFSPNLDQLKVELVSDPNYFCFTEYAMQHGFLVDLNCPWRIAVDLDSSTAREYILNGRNINSFEAFYSQVLTLKVGYDDFWAVKTFFELLYIQYSSDIGLESLPVNFSTLSTLEWLDCLLLNRFRELGLSTQREKRTELYFETYRKVVDIYGSFGLDSRTGAVAYINDFCGNTIRLITQGA